MSVGKEVPIQGKANVLRSPRQPGARPPSDATKLGDALYEFQPLAVPGPKPLPLRPEDLKNHCPRSGVERLGNWMLAHDEKAGRQGRSVCTRQSVRHAPGAPVAQLAGLADRGISMRVSLAEISHVPALTAFARPDPLIDDPHSQAAGNWLAARLERHGRSRLLAATICR
jgi:hypothetical protein